MSGAAPPSGNGVVGALQDLAPRGWVNAVGTLVASAGAFVGGVKAPDTGWWLAGGTVSAVVAVALPAWLAWAERAVRIRTEIVAARLQADLQVVTGRVLAPVAQSIAEINTCADPARKNALRGQIQTKLLHAALALSGNDDARAVLYRLGTAPAPRDRVLTLIDNVGRRDVARQSFDTTDARHQTILKTINERDTLFVEDAHALDAAYYGPRSYRTFVAAPVYAGDKSLGLLAVDAPDAGGLNQSLAGTMEALASMMAVVMVP